MISGAADSSLKMTILCCISPINSKGVLFFKTIFTFEPALTVNSSTSYFISEPKDPIFTTCASCGAPPPHAINTNIESVNNNLLYIFSPLSFEFWN